MASFAERVRQLEESWKNEERWKGIVRPYSAEDVIKLRGSLDIEHTLARRGAEKLWKLLHTEDYVAALGALTGNQAVQQVKAGLKAIYLSGWQVAADANLAGQMYPDQSLYPSNSVPHVVKRINQALQRADQIQYLEGSGDVDYFVPIVADAEAGFGGQLNVFELMKAMIEAGAAGVHFEDQLSSEKKCGHLGGKVLLPTQTAIRNLIAARLAADVMGVPTVLIARTDANAADLITSDIDPRDQAFITGERTPEGFYRTRAGLDQAIARGLPMRRMPTSFGVRRASRTWMRRAGLPKPFMRSSQASCWRTTARRRSTGRKNWTMKRSPNSSKSSAKWDTSSNLSLWLASMRSTTACSNWRAATKNAAWRRTPSCSKPNLPPRSTDTRRRAISVKSARAISTKSPK
ncbi:Isocitrate lyase [Geobacillus sp. BCO2]|nr:Isocitrate lyase [Geobacillus sp. BCO2]